MQRASGFTLVEVVIVIVVGGILTSMAMNRFSGVQSKFAVRSARGIFASYSARARARAIERGTQATFWADPAGDSIWITQGSDRIVLFDFSSQDIDMQSDASSPIEVCFTARGYADDSCNSFSSAITVTFAQGAYSSELEVWPLGQVKY